MLLGGTQRERNKWSPPLKNPSPPLPSPPSTPLSLPPTNLHPGKVHVSQQAKFLHTLTAAVLSFFVWPMHVESRTLSVEWQVKDREIQGWKNKNTSNTQVHTYITYIHTYIHDFYIPQKKFTFFPMIPGGYTVDIMGKITTKTIIIIII